MAARKPWLALLAWFCEMAPAAPAVEQAIAEGNVGIDSFVRMRTVDLTIFEPYAGYSEADLRFIMRRISGWHVMGR